MANFDWDGFKEERFAVKCETEAAKEKFFADCRVNGVHEFLSDNAKRRKIFVCVLRYKSNYSSGRYELAALSGWEIEPNAMYGFAGLPVVVYDAGKVSAAIVADENNKF